MNGKFCWVLVFCLIRSLVFVNGDELQDGTGKDREVVFSQKSQAFAEEISLSLGGSGEGELIRYTLDGSDPSESSEAFRDSLTINESTRIRARIFRGAEAVGTVGMESFLRFSPELISFQSSLPVIVIESWGKSFPVSKQVREGGIAFIEPDEKTGLTSFGGPFDIACRFGGRRRGSSSLKYEKYSLKVEARDESSEDLDIEPFGMPKGSDWVLASSYEMDRSLIRDALIFELSNQAGEYAPRTQFVELFVNTDGSPFSYEKNYFGVYALTESIKRGAQRVDVDKLAPDATSGDDLTGGYIFKDDRVKVGELGFQVHWMGNYYWVYPNERDIQPKQSRYLKNYLNQFTMAARAPGGRHPILKTHFTDYIDKRSWLVWHWMNTMALNLDTYKGSAYYYKSHLHDQGGKMKAGPLWDFDRSMNSSDPRDDSPFGWGAPGAGGRTFEDQRSPWWGMILADPDFRQAHTDLWQEMRRGSLSWEQLESTIDDVAFQLQTNDQGEESDGWGKSPVERNFAKWSKFPPRRGNHAGEIEILKDWLRARVEWIDSQFTSPPYIQGESRWVSKGGEIEMEGPMKMQIFYTLDGSDPREPGGAVSPRALNGNEITVDRSMVVTARTLGGLGGRSWSGPIRRVFLVGEGKVSQVRLEVTAIEAAPKGPVGPDETKVTSNPADFEYFEIRNSDPTRVVDLTGARFTKGVEFPFDRGVLTKLGPGERIVLVRNRAAFLLRHGSQLAGRIAGQYESSKLDNKGELIRLEDGVGQVLLEERYSGEVDDQ